MRYNSVVVIDADGSIVGNTYIPQVTHIPDGPGYQETFYFFRPVMVILAYASFPHVTARLACGHLVGISVVSESGTHLGVTRRRCSLVYPTAIGS
jgi:hypothetical protein